jgi:hypothetical protein
MKRILLLGTIFSTYVMASEKIDTLLVTLTKTQLTLRESMTGAEAPCPLATYDEDTKTMTVVDANEEGEFTLYLPPLTTAKFVLSGTANVKSYVNLENLNVEASDFSQLIHMSGEGFSKATVKTKDEGNVFLSKLGCYLPDAKLLETFTAEACGASAIHLSSKVQIANLQTREFGSIFVCGVSQNEKKEGQFITIMKSPQRVTVYH